MNISSILGGLAGACALTVINEAVKRIDKNAPRMDLLGMNAVAKILRKDKALQPLESKLEPMSLIGDLVSNSLFYGMASGTTKSQTFIRGAMLGLGAGMGAVTIPKTMGVRGGPADYPVKTKVLTVAWYVIGGMVAAAVINALEKRPTSVATRKVKEIQTF